ncbi:tripartite ATP-independent transporter DctP family solute receptor [Natranaerovirga hydrolytica]|uniref:Tripartite ATP-independent transporter DctP family solute receptor n=1 Tax=Natranaerovirga hydrolytica TaxID=680378 RepID=A0A4R1MRP2_9FIRM|nr:TRAP transporter substrate-binding protein [Natranaerovirga hydrolytica]TCK93239.1 tripartite ATP-independent transporter DctP family solute receptor [Natranaerovirga hydrolytica]
MKKLLSIIMTLVIILSITACSSSDDTNDLPDNGDLGTEEILEPDDSEDVDEPTEQITLRLAELHAEDYPTTLANYEFARLVEERSNGRIKIDVYAGGQLGDEKAVIEQLQFGGIDFARVSLAPFAEFSRDLNALMMPYLYRDADHMWNVLNGEIGQELLESVYDAGFIGLCWYDGGARNFYTSTEVNSLEDLSGLKIRVQENQLMFSLIEHLGASPVSVPMGDIYTAVQTGVIEGAENNWPTYESFSQYEVAPYFVLDGHTRVPEILAASKSSLESKLSDEDIQMIIECAKETQEFQIQKWNEREEASREIVENAGTITVELSQEELQKFSDAVQPIYEMSPYNEYEEIVSKIRDVQ